MQSSPGFEMDWTTSHGSGYDECFAASPVLNEERGQADDAEPGAQSIWGRLGLEDPDHLEPLTSFFARVATARIEGGRAPEEAKSVPPRHWKTTTILGCIVALCEMFPGFRVLYLTYSHPQGDRKSREAQRMWRRLGHGAGDRWTFAEWTTDNGCLLRFGGLIGGATGDGFDLIVVDDPYRTRADAESATIRDRIEESFGSDVYTRQQNTPTAQLVNHTRWHVADLIDTVTDPAYHGGRPFRYDNIPAIDPARMTPHGVLLPKYWPLERLKPFMANAYDWASLYQGNPQPRGNRLFGDPERCHTHDIPAGGLYAIGVDFAYTKKTKGDWSGYVVMKALHGKYWVVDFEEWQEEINETERRLMKVAKDYPGAPFIWHVSGIEKKGVAPNVRVPIRVMDALVDKFTRALPLCKAWNQEPDSREPNVVVPFEPWAKGYIRTMQRFTGADGEKDDAVDMTTSAFSVLEGKAVVQPPPVTSSSRRVTANAEEWL